MSTPPAKKTPAKKAPAKRPAKKTAAPSRARRDQIRDRRSQFGWILNVMDADKEIKSLFTQAVNGNWTEDRFVARLRGTKWFKQHSEAFRQAETLRTSDPASYKRQKDIRRAEIMTRAASIGVTLDDAAADSMADTFMHTAWTTDELLTQLAPRLSSSAGNVQSAAGQLEQFARANGVHTVMNQGWFENAARDIVLKTAAGSDGGQAAAATYQEQLRQAAASKYGAWSDRILAGENVADIAQAWLGTARNLLEDDTIDLTDASVSKALTSLDEKGNPAVTPLWKFEQQVRADGRWKQTKNAKQTFVSAGRSLLKAWGLED
jgi:hypothetical protein